MLFLSIEIISVICSVVYLWLLTRQDIRCWIFGIAGSALGAYLMWQKGLPGQSLVYTYYALAGVYGWWYWKKQMHNQQRIHVTTLVEHGVWIGIIACASTLLIVVLKQLPHASMPIADAIISVSCIAGTLMQARRWLSSWMYWFIIDAASMWLYASQELWLYAALMIVYCILCVNGYRSWKKSLTENIHHAGYEERTSQ